MRQADLELVSLSRLIFGSAELSVPNQNGPIDLWFVSSGLGFQPTQEFLVS